MVRGRLRSFVNFAGALTVESPMLGRVAVVVGACVLGAGLGAVAAVAEELDPDQAKAFVVGKLFAYTCFDGTAGMGRIFADGSVVGTIRPGGRGEMRFASLPPGTLRVEGSSMCAHLSGLPLTPCFKVQKIDYRSFRGSISGLGFAYCDFSQHNSRAAIIGRAPDAPTQPTRRMTAATALHMAPLAPVQAAPLAPVEAVPIAPAEPMPITPPEPIASASAPAAASAPAPVTSSAPAPATPIATLRPAIND
jgi:hypothetical protein